MTIAFDRLRHYARSHSLRLTEVARQIVETELLADRARPSETRRPAPVTEAGSAPPPRGTGYAGGENGPSRRSSASAYSRCWLAHAVMLSARSRWSSAQRVMCSAKSR